MSTQVLPYATATTTTNKITQTCCWPPRNARNIANAIVRFTPCNNRIRGNTVELDVAAASPSIPMRILPHTLEMLKTITRVPASESEPPMLWTMVETLLITKRPHPLAQENEAKRSQNSNFFQASQVSIKATLSSSTTTSSSIVVCWQLCASVLSKVGEQIRGPTSSLGPFASANRSTDDLLAFNWNMIAAQILTTGTMRAQKRKKLGRLGEC
mmetsp:Transcript_9751/g.22957  ORF Transcript_9751/g.22957 Transcript_9751/m.22957 type:complete len:213 (-) Transcript_9751:2586-3224(-)